MRRNKKRDALPSRQAITDHWFPNRMGELGIFHYSQDELPDSCCWACGRAAVVQRCHIKSHQHGGADTVENLVILCPGCHDESEDLPESSFFPWIRAKRQGDWQDEFTHVARKMARIGYSWPVVKEMVETLGQDATTDTIASAYCADPGSAATMAHRIKAFAA